MADKIAPEVAESLVSEWSEALGASLALDSRSRLVRAVVAGRLDFDGERFTYGLLSPIALENGTTVGEIVISEPTTAQLRDMSKGGGDAVTQSTRLLSAITGNPLGVVERIKMRDAQTLGAIMDFFG
jgi:hypothetical protein